MREVVDQEFFEGFIEAQKYFLTLFFFLFQFQAMISSRRNLVRIAKARARVLGSVMAGRVKEK
jgi:hypothetical protein